MCTHACVRERKIPPGILLPELTFRKLTTLLSSNDWKVIPAYSFHYITQSSRSFKQKKLCTCIRAIQAHRHKPARKSPHAQAHRHKPSHKLTHSARTHMPAYALTGRTYMCTQNIDTYKQGGHLVLTNSLHK